MVANRHALQAIPELVDLSPNSFGNPGLVVHIGPALFHGGTVFIFARGHYFWQPAISSSLSVPRTFEMQTNVETTRRFWLQQSFGHFGMTNCGSRTNHETRLRRGWDGFRRTWGHGSLLSCPCACLEEGFPRLLSLSRSDTPYDGYAHIKTK